MRSIFVSIVGQHIRLISHPLCNWCGRPFPDAAATTTPAVFVFLGRRGLSPRAPGPVIRARKSTDASGAPGGAQIQIWPEGFLGEAVGPIDGAGLPRISRRMSFDLIVPVPLHPKRLRWRAFNQSLLLAREIGRAYNMPMDPFVLRRDRDTPPQTQLPEDERRRNVRGVFSLNPDRPLKAKAYCWWTTCTLRARP